MSTEPTVSPACPATRDLKVPSVRPDFPVYAASRVLRASPDCREWTAFRGRPASPDSKGSTGCQVLRVRWVPRVSSPRRTVPFSDDVRYFDRTPRSTRTSRTTRTFGPVGRKRRERYSKCNTGIVAVAV